MATQVDELEDPNKKGAGGAILAGGGSSGPAPASDGALGSGWTNLQTYLGANKGNGEGVANEIIGQGQKQFDTNLNTANTAANDWAGSQIANKDFNGSTNGLEKNFQNAAQGVDSFANDFDTQKAGLQKAHGYGNGFAATDTFLGRQDGQGAIKNWQANTVGGMKDGGGEYKGIAAAKNQVFNAGLANAPASKSMLDTPIVSGAAPLDIQISDNFGAGLQKDLFGDGTIPKPKPKPQPQISHPGNRKAY